MFQGEEVTFVGDLSGTSQLIGVAGNAEGQVLEENVDESQTPGRYAIDGNGSKASLTVTTPRINTAEVQIGQGGSDIAGETVSTADAGNLQVFAEYNFDDAEELEVEVQDESGTDITDAVLNDTDALFNQSGQYVGLDLANEDAGEYTVILAGASDLDVDSVEELTFTITTDEEVSIETSEDSVTRGSNVEYTVSGGTSGDTHNVTIDADDFRDSFDADNNPTVFRNTGDTVRVGFVDNNGNFETNAGDLNNPIEFAVAEVEMDGAQGVGTIRTDNLDDTSVDLDVYAEDDSVSSIQDGSASSVDDASVDVSEGQITIDSPGNEYTIGSEVGVNGTATGIDNVDVYVRNNDDWQLLLSDIETDSDDEYEEEDVTLSDTGQPGASILGQAGTYRYGVIDSEEYNGAANLTTSEFSQGTSTSQSITTVEGQLSAELQTINGQINTADDAADITGNAEGQNQVALIFVDERGDVAAELIDVEDDGTIDIEDYQIPNRAGIGGQFSTGTVTAHFVSQGRDTNIGDGDIPGQAATLDGLVDFVNQNVTDSNLNAEQARQRILSETTEDTASDDLMVTQTFRYAESQTTIQSVYPEEAQAEGVNPVATGETMVVEGSTNLRPDSNSITVEVLNENGDSLVISSTDEWADSGQWNTTVDTSDLEPGTYTVESDDGDNTDRAEIEIVEERQTDNGTDTGGDDGAS
ncbi:major cell surface glycoprotein, partial [Halorubrum sp. E3]